MKKQSQLTGFNRKKANSSKTTTKYKSSYYCNDCRKPITYAVFKYSIRNFDKPLCIGCQPIKEKTTSVPPQKNELNRPRAHIEIGGKQPKKKTKKFAKHGGDAQISI